MSRHVLLAAACCSGLAAAPGAALADQTASGTVTSMSRSALVSQPQADGTIANCEIWKGALTTTDGQVIGFYVETPLTGSPESDQGLRPTDPHAFPTAQTLQRARLGPPNVTTISYAGAVDACGIPLTNVVTSASLVLVPQPCVVPDLAGRTLASAEQELKAAWCAAGPITRRRSATAPKGRVISSSPKAGSRRGSGAHVALTVSRGSR